MIEYITTLPPILIVAYIITTMTLLLGGFMMLWLAVHYLVPVNRLKRPGCKYMGWHNGRGGQKSFDGCSQHATCSWCGKDVMQDSQGNWF